MIHVDNSFFDVFSTPLLIGDKKEVLTRPNTVAISEKAALKYFGAENPIGKILRMDDKDNVEVTGVFENIPANTHYYYDFLLLMESLDESKENVWLSMNFNTYIVLKEQTKPEQVEEKFGPMLKKYLGPDIQMAMGISLEELVENGGRTTMYLQPLEDIHLHSDLDSELGPNSDIKYVYIFSLIAIFILVIASINFMNISTARSATRAKEVGVRKVLGSDRHELFNQFMAESFLTTLLSLTISIGLVELSLPFFNQLAGQQLTISYIENPMVLILFAGMLVFMGILAGSYPAFVLSAFKPSRVLSGKVKNSAKFGYFRSGLVVFQFSASILLMIATLVVNRKLDFIQNKKLGLDKEHVVILQDAHLLGKQAETLKNEMLNNPNVISASVSGFLPVPSSHNNTGVWLTGKKKELVAVNNWMVDYDYVKTMKLQIAEGRDFSEKFGTDKEKILVNESFVKLFGFDKPVGQKMNMMTYNVGESREYTIMGVVKDFHFESLRMNIEPLILYIGNSRRSISFRITGENTSSIVEELKVKWKKFLPEQPFNYSFLDDKFMKMYSSEQKTSEIFGVFATLAVFIGCLGLFSLSAFAAEQKTKEIGIRKVLGSTVSGIVYMLTREFLKLIVIAFIIASVAGYYFMDKWLMDFAYRTTLNWWIFALAGLATLLISIITVSFQAVKAALANPVESLRDE